MQYSSDQFICNTYAYLTYEHKKGNDRIFMNQMTSPQPICPRNVSAESEMWLSNKFSARVKTCTPEIMTRGGNALVPPGSAVKAGYPAWPVPNGHPNDFMLNPCQSNTWRNHIESDDEKACTVKHQMFMNCTKRK